VITRQHCGFGSRWPFRAQGFADRSAAPATASVAAALANSTWARPTGFAVDSPLEGDGFELSVPATVSFVAADSAGLAGRIKARNERHCSSRLLEEAGFEPSVPRQARQGTAFFTEGNELYPLPITTRSEIMHQAKSG
jgi:hypothetical protein